VVDLAHLIQQTMALSLVAATSAFQAPALARVGSAPAVSMVSPALDSMP
jgi:hypothetical protein